MRPTIRNAPSCSDFRRRRDILAAAAAALAALSGAAPAAAADMPAAIPPVERPERHFESGATYLRGLPEGTRATIERADGVRFTLRQRAGRLGTSLPPATLSADRRTFTTPLGYRLYVQPGENTSPERLVIEAPNGNWTQFLLQSNAQLLSLWTRQNKAFVDRVPEGSLVLRLSDGSRLDTTDYGERWEVMTLGGERARLEFAKAEWTLLPPLPSPPLIPDTESHFVMADGETWGRPVREDHVVFAWNWYPIGFAPADAVEDVRARRGALDAFFAGLALPQEPFEMAGYILGRRLALGGGDRVTFEIPGARPATVYLLPKSIEVAAEILRSDPKRRNPPRRP